MTEETVGLGMADIDDSASLADLFLAASQELARSDARIYRSVDRHLRRTRELLAQEDARQGRGGGDPQLIRDKAPGSVIPLLQGDPSYERQSRSCLQRLCREHGIRGYSRMNKTQLIAALRGQGVAAPPVPLQAFNKAELLALIEELTKS